MIYTLTNVEFVQRKGYDILDIKVAEGQYAGKSISCFLTDDIVKDLVGGWQPGFKVEIDIFEKAKGDKKYLNFKPGENQPENKPKEDYTESIDRRHYEKSDGMALGNAKSCATQLTIAMLANIKEPQGFDKVIGTWERFVNRIYSHQPHNPRTGEEGVLPF